MDNIVRIQLHRVEKLLADRRMALTLDDGALAWLGDKGYDPVYGARPLKRAIQREVETPLARKILEGAVRDGQTVVVDCPAKSEGLTFSAKGGEAAESTGTGR